MAASSHPDQPAAKRVKTDLSNILKASVQPKLLTADSVLDCIAHFTRKQILAVESCMYHELHDKFVRSQLRLIEAQRPHIARLHNARILYHAMKPSVKEARQLAQILGTLSQHPEISDSVKDAVRYYEATCIGICCMSQQSTTCNLNVATLAGDIDPATYFERLVEASERYLKPTAPTSHNPRPATSAETSEVSVSAPASDKHAAFSDEYLQGKVSDFIVKDEELREAIPWADVDDCGSGLKEELDQEITILNSSYEDLKDCPPGVLLHGDQGTGKTSFVESFAANYKLKMYKVGPDVQGALRGQSEKLMRYIFQAARESARERPCVLFFDEVDGILGGSSQQTSGFESLIKIMWSDFIRARVQCFIFGSTNKPWLLSMGDLSRRFECKVHILMPKADARKAIVRHTLQNFWHDIDNNGFDKIAAATEGYSTNDISKGVRKKVKLLHLECLTAKWWQSITIGDTTYSIPTEKSRAGARSASADTIMHKKHRQLTAKMVVDLFESGVVRKTTSHRAEEEHRKWNADNTDGK